MSLPSSTYSSEIFNAFKKIKAKDYRTIVRFYEEHQLQILTLKYEERFELLIAYIESLFETGAYQKYLDIVYDAIEISIMNNIKIHKGYNIFQRLLFRKAASHYHLIQYDQAEHILKELVKICPSEDTYIRFLQKCMRRQKPSYLKTARAFGIVCFFVSAAIILIELFYVRHFYQAYTSIVELSRNLIFALGCISIIAGESFYFWKTRRFVHSFVKKVKAEKLRKFHERRKKQPTH